MEQALQVTFRDVPSSPAAEVRIREHAAELEQFCDRIVRVRIERHRIVIGPEATEHRAHEDRGGARP